ncbi:unnamed protein product [Albugo candida]|uniref:Uncharacterized protein n=1 Tax=Albugo candida TaxID=65357 RepID=A0A024GTU1_9STRA|nr:unnamed protein product [Albugo candida]|eukprot:CCI49779.1 unnamed protein product [Albugo candida]
MICRRSIIILPPMRWIVSRLLELRLKSAHTSDSCDRSIKSRLHRPSSKIPTKWSLAWSFPPKGYVRLFSRVDRFLKAQTTHMFDETLTHYLNREKLRSKDIFRILQECRRSSASSFDQFFVVMTTQVFVRVLDDEDDNVVAAGIKYRSIGAAESSSATELSRLGQAQTSRRRKCSVFGCDC